mgnify:CR=1 FL=1
MSRAFPLQILMDQASSRNEATAARLAEAGARLAEAEKQLDQLLGYRTDYQARFRSAVAAGTDSAGWRNFHEFMDRLDAAIAQQREAVTLAASVQEGVRREWIAEQNRIKAYDTLAQRHRGAERRREARIEQREQDEHSLKIHAQHRR